MKKFIFLAGFALLVPAAAVGGVYGYVKSVKIKNSIEDRIKGAVGGLADSAKNLINGAVDKVTSAAGNAISGATASAASANGVNVDKVLENVTNAQRESASTTSSITKHEVKNYTAEQINEKAYRYIAQRTVSLQVLKPKSSNQVSATAGTAWIFNQERGTDNYYLATNLHVAASLLNTTLTKNQYNRYSLLYGTKPLAAYIGFIDEQSFKDNSLRENNARRFNGSFQQVANGNINFLKIDVPTISYIGTSSLANFEGTFAKNYSNLNYQTTSTNTSTVKTSHEASVDIAILKVNFNPARLSSLNVSSTDQLQGNIANVDKFAKWLQIYNQNPTKYDTTPANLEHKLKNHTYYSAGFPSNTLPDVTVYPNSYNNTRTSSLNFTKVAYYGMNAARVGIEENDRRFIFKLDENPNNGYYNKATVKAYEPLINSKTANLDGILAYKTVTGPRGNASAYANSNVNERKTLETYNFFNASFNLYLDKRSKPGSSGSMIVSFDPTKDEFYVSGIYWGAIDFSLDNYTRSRSRSYGGGSLLYVNDFDKSSNKDYSYNIFQDAMEFIKTKELHPNNQFSVTEKSKKVEFEYNPVFSR